MNTIKVNVGHCLENIKNIIVEERKGGILFIRKWHMSYSYKGYSESMIQCYKTKLPTNKVAMGTVRLSSSTVLKGWDSTSVAARETTKKPKTIPQVSSRYPNEEK